MAALTDQSVVDLPLSITEDMLVGAIDFERAVKEGKRNFPADCCSVPMRTSSMWTR